MKKMFAVLSLTLFMLSVKDGFAEQEFTLSVPEDKQPAKSVQVEPEDTAAAAAYAPMPATPPQSDGQKQQRTQQKNKAQSSANKSGQKSQPQKTEQKGSFPESGGNEDMSSMPAATFDTDSSSQIAMPEVVQRAVLSRSDVNRIVCREPIKEIFFSDEKGISKVSYSGNSAFIKFMVKKVGKAYEYVTMPIDLTVICGESVFTLIGFPKAVPAQTIRLESGRKAKARENISIFKDQPERLKAKALIERAYNDDIPSSFTVKTLNVSFSVFKDISTTLNRVITIDGEGLIVKEFHLVPSVNNLELNEKDFLRKEFANNPFALGFTELRPSKGEKVRLFVVETKASITGGTDVE